MARIEITRYYNHKSTSPNLIHKNIRKTIVKAAKNVFQEEKLPNTNPSEQNNYKF